MRRTILAVLGALSLLLPAVSRSQVDTAWVRRYDGPGDYWDWARAIAVDGSGNVYVTGQSDGSGTSGDYATIKYNSTGETLWVRRYNGPGNNTDNACAVAVDLSGNVYVAGSSYGGQPTNYDCATIKYSPNGDTLWVRRYSYPGNSQDVVEGLGLDGQGNVYVGGWTWSGGTSWRVLVVKYDSAGDFTWSQTYASAYGAFCRAMAVDDSGSVYTTGEVQSSGSSDILTIKYNTDGIQQWVRTYNGPGNPYKEGDAIAIDDSGSVYVTGGSYPAGPDFDYETIKYSSAGVLKWAQIYSHNYDRPQAIAVDDSGNAYVTGGSYLLSGADYFDTEYATMKYDTAGVQEWLQRYNGPSDSGDMACAIVLDEQNNVYITGTSRGLGTGDDFATVKYNTDGAEQWVARYDGPDNGGDAAAAIAIDNQGNIYVTGQSYGIGTNDDYVTIKYVQTPGIEEDRAPLSADRSSPEAGPTVVRGSLRLADGSGASSSPSWLLDAAGRKVADIHSGVNDIRALSPGVYFLRLEGGADPATRKLVVQR